MPRILLPPQLGRGVLAHAPPAAAPSLLLSVSGDNRYLVDANGQPFLLWGTAAWNITNENTIAEQTTRLDTDVSQGSTGTLIQLVSRYQTNAPNDIDGIAPFTTPDDFATANATYFNKAKAVIDLMAARGVVGVLAPAWMGYNTPQGWYDALVSNGNTKCFNYGVFLAGIFAGCDNLILCGAGDRPGSEAHSTTEFQQLIDGWRSVSTRHLWTHHWNFAPSDQYALTPTHINGCYEWGNSWDDSGAAVDAQVAIQYANNDGPCIVLETLYEGNTGFGYSSRGARAAVMQSMLRGAKGFFWGHEGTWHCGAADTNLPSQSQGQPYALSTTDTLEFRNCKTLFSGKAWHLLAPSAGAGELLTAGSGCRAAKTPTGSYAVLYTKGAAMTVDRTKMSGTFSAQWYDITTGSFTTVSGSPFPNTSTQNFDVIGTLGNNSRGETDWALLLEAV